VAEDRDGDAARTAATFELIADLIAELAPGAPRLEVVEPPI
jgi:hypothetical protein